VFRTLKTSPSGKLISVAANVPPTTITTDDELQNTPGLPPMMIETMTRVTPEIKPTSVAISIRYAFCWAPLFEHALQVHQHFSTLAANPQPKGSPAAAVPAAFGPQHLKTWGGTLLGTRTAPLTQSSSFISYYRTRFTVSCSNVSAVVIVRAFA